MATREEKTHATTISHISTTNGTMTTTTTTITTTITTKHRLNEDKKDNEDNNIDSIDINNLIINKLKHKSKFNKKIIAPNQNKNNRKSKNKLSETAIDLYLNNKYFEAAKLIENNNCNKMDDEDDEMHFNYGCICNKLGKYSLACKHFELAIKINDINCQAHNNYAVILNHLNRNIESEYHFKRCLEIDPSNHECHHNYASLLYEIGKFNLSQTHFQQSLALNPNSHESYAEYGVLLMDMKQYNLADKNLKKAIQLSCDTSNDPNNGNAEWHYRYAQLLHKMRKYKESEIHHKESLSLQPQNPRYNDQYGAFLMLLGRFAESSTYFLKAHKIERDNKEYRIMYEFAESMTNIKRVNDVEKNFKNLEKNLNGTLTNDMLKIKKEFQANMVANTKKYQTVKKHFKLKQYEKCRPLLCQLIASNPNNFDYHFLNAKVFESINDYSIKHVRNIINEYKCALSINQMHAGCHFNFAKLLVKIKKFKKAKIHLLAAINANPNHCAYSLYYAVLLMYDPNDANDNVELFDNDNVSDNAEEDEAENPILDYSESEQYFKKCLSLDAKNAECNFKYGLLLIKMRKNSAALSFIRKANKLKNEKEKKYKVKYNKLKNIVEQEKKGLKSNKSKTSKSKTKTRKKNKYDEILIDTDDENEQLRIEKQRQDLKKKQQQQQQRLTEKAEKQKAKMREEKKNMIKKDKKSIIDEKNATYKKYVSLGQYKKARGVMKDLVELDPKNSKFANQYALLLKRDRKKISESEKYFEIAMRLEPHHIVYKSNYGVLLFNNERYKESESYLKYCVMTEPSNAFYNHMYALLLQRQHKFHESFEYHQKAIQLDYMNDKYKHTYNKLIEWYDQFPRQEKERMKRMYLEAESHAKHMEFHIAEPTFKKLVEKNPYNLVYVFRYAYVLQRLKKYNLAEKYYKMCLRIEGDHNICHGDFGLLLSKLKRYKEADVHYKKCLYTDPENWICRKNYAVSLEIRGRYKEAAKYFRQALNINPNDRETNQRYQKLLDRIPKLKQYEKQLQQQQQQKCVIKQTAQKPKPTEKPTQNQPQGSNKKTRRRGRKKRNNNNNVRDRMGDEEEYKKALVLLQQNDNKSAINILKTLVASQRNSFKFGLQYARCLRNEGLFREAIKEYKRILHNNKHSDKTDRGQALYELGKIYENEMSDLQLSAECYREAFELNCRNNLYRQACQNCVKNVQLLEFGRNFSSEQRKKMTLTFESANEYIKCKNYNEAKRLLEDILLINPDYFLYNAKYALVLHRLKLYKLAEKYFQKAIATDPTNSISRGVYGGMLFQLKRYDEAEQELKVCLAINPNNWICHQDYARLLEYKNDLKSAAFHSKKAFEINPSDHESYQRYQYLLKKIEKERPAQINRNDNDNNTQIVRLRASEHKQPTYTSKVVGGAGDNISVLSSDSMNNGLNTINNIQMIEPMDDRSQYIHHTRHSIASTQSPQSGLHSPTSNYSSNNFALSPTRTIVSVSSNNNNTNNNKIAKKNANTISLSSMYSYDGLETVYTPHEQHTVITPTSTNSIFNFSNNASNSFNNNNNNNGFSWSDFDISQQFMKAKNFISAEPILNELVLSLINFDCNAPNIPYFNCIHLYAQCLYEMNKFEDALKYFKMALIYNEHHCDCNYKYAKLLKKFEQFDESQIYFEKCCKLSPYEPDYFYQYGLLLELINEQSEAIKQFEKAYYLKPDILKFKMKLDQIKLKEKNKNMRKQQDRILNGECYNNEQADFEGDIQDIEDMDEEKQNKIYPCQPNDAIDNAEENKLKMAQKCVAEKDWNGAKLLYAELIDFDGNNTDFNILYSYASVLRQCGAFKQCVEYYELAIGINSEHALCFYEYGNVLHRELNNINKAMYQYEKCLKLTNYKMHSCLFDYAIVLQRKKKTKEAAKYFKKAIIELTQLSKTIESEKSRKTLINTLANYHNRYGLLLRNEAKYLLANEEFKLAISYNSHNGNSNRVDFEANHAYSLFLNERYKESEVGILSCLERDDENAFVNHVYALLLRRTNRFAEAFQYHHKAIQLNPHNKEFKKRYDEFLEYSNRFSHDEKQKMKRKFDRAQQMIKTKHFEKARVLLKQLSNVNPYNIVYVFKFAFVLHRLKQYKEAERYYKLALNVEGDHSICHFDYGLMLSKLRRLEEAQYHYKRCLHMNPQDWICHINYARLLEKKCNFKDAAFHLEKALQINPNDAEAHQCYSQVVKKLKQQKHWTKKEQSTANNNHNCSAKAISPWRRVTTPSPKKLTDTMSEQHVQEKKKEQPAMAKPAKPTKAPIRNRPIYNLSNALNLYENGQFIKSRQIFIKLVETDRTNYQYVIGYARCLYFGLQELNNAEQQYRNALNINHSDDELHYELGLVLFDLNRLTESGDFIVNALEINADNIEYNYQYALILQELNDFRSALSYYHKCAEMQSDYKDIQTRIDALSAYDDAFDDYNNFIEPESDSQSALMDVNDIMVEIKSLIFLKEYRTAKELLAPFMADAKLTIDNFEYIIKYAEILLKLNEFNESEEYYKIALKLEPEEPTCYYNLGIICEQRHRNEEALMYLEKAAALQPNNNQFRNKYNESLVKLQQQQHANSNIAFGSLFAGSSFDIFHTDQPQPPQPHTSTSAPSSGPPIQTQPEGEGEENLTTNSKPIEYDYNSYLFAPSPSPVFYSNDQQQQQQTQQQQAQYYYHHHHHHSHSHHHEYGITDEEKINDIFATLPSITDDIETETVQSSINEEKTVEETQHQSYCEKQRRLEFRLFLQEKVQFNTKHFDQYFRRFVNEGLADIRMVPYLDELTLTNIGMIKPHQKLMLNKIAHFQQDMKLFANIFKIVGIPTRYFNNFGDYGICTIQSFCNNFKNKSDLRYIMDNNDVIIEQLWQQIQIAKHNEYNDHQY